MFGNIKNANCENVDRDFVRAKGLPIQNIAIAVAMTSYNMRQLRDWNDKTGKGPADHILLWKDREVVGTDKLYEADLDRAQK